jgi:hypothetical protein
MKLSELSKEQKEKLLKEQYSDIYMNMFKSNTWKRIKREFYHRSILKPIPEIENIKKNLEEKLGNITVFFFLNEYCDPFDIKGPYNNLECYLLILYQLVSGCSQSELEIPQSTYQDIYSQFWIDRKGKLFKKNNLILLKFSTIKSRILSASLQNPNDFKSCTVLIDGIHSRINYTNKEDLKKYRSGAFYSYKFKKNGVITNCADSIDGFFIYTSKSKPASDEVDGQQVKLSNGFKLYEELDSKNDCIFFDGGYKLFFNQIVEELNDNGKNFSLDNFIAPPRKTIGIDFEEEETEFINKFGAFRSAKETTFSKFQNIFGRFKKCNSHVYNDLKIFQDQFSLCWIIYNVKLLIEKLTPEIDDFMKYWLIKDFDFKFDDDDSDEYESQKINEIINSVGNISKNQNDFDFNIQINKSQIQVNEIQESDESQIQMNESQGNDENQIQVNEIQRSNEAKDINISPIHKDQNKIKKNKNQNQNQNTSGVLTRKRKNENENGVQNKLKRGQCNSFVSKLYPNNDYGSICQLCMERE